MVLLLTYVKCWLFTLEEFQLSLPGVVKSALGISEIYIIVDVETAEVSIQVTVGMESWI